MMRVTALWKIHTYKYIYICVYIYKYTERASAQRARVEGTWCASPIIETFSRMLMSRLHVCVNVLTLFSKRQGDDDSKYCSGPALRQWHAGTLAALASQRDAEQRQGTARLLPRAFGTLLQRKRLVQEGINARCLFLLFLFAGMHERSRD